MLGARDRRCNISRGPVQAGLLGKVGVKEAEVLVELEGEVGSSCLKRKRYGRCLHDDERGWHRRQEELRRGGGARADGSGRGEARVRV